MKPGTIENAPLAESARDHLIAFGLAGPAEPPIVEGKGAEVTDDQGKTYIDLEAGPGVSNVGHCHPKVTAAIARQAAKLIHNPGRYVTRLQVSLAQRLSGHTGGLLEKAFFASTGAEACDGAIKLAMKHAVATRKKGLGIIALQHSFHGRLSLPAALTGVSQRKVGFGPYATFPGVVHAPAPYCYRCPIGLKFPSCGVKCADMVEDLLLTSVPGGAAVMIAEPILGVGGVICPPDEYWTKIAAICRKNGITLILDEVFTGIGRTGAFFAYQHLSIRPDIVVFAKAIANGIPLGGFIATREIGDAMKPGDHSTTMGSSNQVGLAAAHAVLDIMEEEKLADVARQRGERFLTGLRALADRYAFVGDVRGRGLMIGVEIVKDKESREPSEELAEKIVSHIRRNGVLVSLSGVHHNTLRITPPLVITVAQIDAALKVMDAACTAAAR